MAIKKNGNGKVSASDARWLAKFREIPVGARSENELIRALGLESIYFKKAPFYENSEGERLRDACRKDALRLIDELLAGSQSCPTEDEYRFGPVAESPGSSILAWASYLSSSRVDAWILKGIAPLGVWSKADDFEEELLHRTHPRWTGIAELAYFLAKSPLEDQSEWHELHEGDCAHFKRRVKSCASFAKKHIHAEQARLAVREVASEVSEQMGKPKGMRFDASDLLGCMMVAGQFLGEEEAKKILGPALERAQEIEALNDLRAPWLEPLTRAIALGHLAVAKVLLAELIKIDPFILGGGAQESGVELLRSAIHFCSFPGILWLIEEGAELGCPVGKDGKDIGRFNPLSQLRDAALSGSPGAEAAMLAVGKLWVSEMMADGLSREAACRVVDRAMKEGYSSRSAKNKSSFERLVFAQILTLNDDLRDGPAPVAKKARSRL